MSPDQPPAPDTAPDTAPAQPGGSGQDALSAPSPSPDRTASGEKGDPTRHGDIREEATRRRGSPDATVPPGDTPRRTVPGGDTPRGDTPGPDTAGLNTAESDTPGSDASGSGTPGPDTPGANTAASDTSRPDTSEPNPPPGGSEAAPDGPPLREPDLPRTAKERPKALRTGWTTGTCASAAARAAALHLVTGEPQRWTEVALPSGRRVTFAVERSVEQRPGRTEAVVVKDAGDDPDVTHGSWLTATVSWRDEPGIALHGGIGVGVVTKPGLGLEVGGPAINPTPRAMINQAVGEVMDLSARGVDVTISVPDGEQRARRTTNAKLGILGGISILGTTGIVRPFSTASWRASVEQAVSVAAAQQVPAVVLCTGGRTERGAMELLPQLPPVCFIEVGDFTGAALRRAMEHGVRRVVFVGMVGKLTKLASGVLMTHYTRSKVDTQLLAGITRTVGDPGPVAAQVARAHTARHAYELWDGAGLLRTAGAELCRRVAEVISRFTDREVAAEAAMVDFTGRELIASGTADGVTGRLLP